MIKIDFSQLHFESQEARESILRRGSKPLNYLHDKWKGTKLEQHLPGGTHYLAPEESRDLGKVLEFIASIDVSSHPKIVRGCLPPFGNYCGDFAGAVDVFETISDIGGRESLQSAIESILEDARSQSIVKEFIEWESGKKFDGKIGVLVQDYYGNITGSLIEHPVKSGIFIVERMNPDSITFMRGHSVYRDNEEIITNSFFMEDKTGEVLKAIDIYKAVKESGLIPADYTFQMEYGVDSNGLLRIYQTRLFRKKEDRGDFEIPDEEVDIFTYDYHSFGVTPKEGIEVPVTYLNHEGVENFRSYEKAGYLYRDPSSSHQSPNPSIKPDNLSVFWAGHEMCFLEHGFYRFGIKGDIFLVRRANEVYIDEDTDPKEIKIRVFSNGISGGIKYLDNSFSDFEEDLAE